MVDGQVLAAGSEFQFHTAGGGKFSFLVFGDSGAASAEQRSLIQLMAAEPDVAMAIHVGDLAYPEGSFANFESGHYGPNAPLMRRLALFSTPGNHEYNTPMAAPYLAGVVTPDSGIAGADRGRYYSFDRANTHFVSLDSNLLLTSSATQMLAWLEADLAATQQRWRIVFLHHPPYPTGFHLGDPVCEAVSQLVVPIVERHGVQLVLSGHEHGYERTYPLARGAPADAPFPSTLYVITGGGGGALESVGSVPQCALSVEAFNYLRVDVDHDVLRLRAFGLNREVIDDVRLGHPIGHLRAPTIDRILSAGGLEPSVARGSLIFIAGQNLATHTTHSSNQPKPGSLGEVIVTADGVVTPLLSVSPLGINAQLPYEVSGPIELRVLTPDGSASTNLTVLPAAPSLLEVRSANLPLHFSNPVRPGADIRLYLTGLGALEEPLDASLEVWLGNRRLDPSFAGPESGRSGVYRIDAVVPPNLPDGLYALKVTANGFGSRPMTIDVYAGATTARNDRARLRVEVSSSNRP